MLSISIVTYNSQRLIQKSIASLMAHWPDKWPVDITIVDNCSDDNTLKILDETASRLEGLKVINNRRNLGFGRAHNQVIMNAQSRYHIICNPDIFITTDIFSKLVEFMERHPDVGMACPRFYYPDGNLQYLNRRHPTVLDLSLRRFLPDAFKAFFRHRLKYYEMRDVGYDRECDVPFISGAFMCCRTNALKSVGGFDQRYFLYFEDADLSRKFQRIKYRTVYCPGIEVIHVWERLAHKEYRAALVFSASAIKYFFKWGFKIL